MIPIVRLFKPKGPDRVAVVSVQAAWAHPGSSTIQVVRGPRRNKLSAGTTYGPFTDDVLPQQHAALLDLLGAEGFAPSGRFALLGALDSGDAGERARAALRFGWRRDTSAVEKLLELAARQTEDLSSVIDALGLIGDARAVDVCRAEAARKLLSRRRSGVEALRNLQDTTGLIEVRQRAMERLPDPVREAFALTENDASTTATDALLAAVNAVPIKDRGLAIDTLYELATDASVRAARRALTGISLGQPFVWRYARSVFKRSMLRRDAETFAQLAHDIEIEARTSQGTIAQVKSGLDGVTRSMSIFKPGTQRFHRRLAWRFLRTVARWRPTEYAPIAAMAVSAYTPADAQAVKGFRWEWSDAYVFHRVLFGASDRFKFDARKLRFKFKSAKATKAPTAREESFPELWDRTPTAYLTLLARSTVEDVQSFALTAVTQRHASVVQQASFELLFGLLNSPSQGAVELSLGELDRRFASAAPDDDLIARLAGDSRASVAQLGRKWLTSTCASWTQDVERVMRFLALPESSARVLAAGLVTASLDDADAWFKRELAERILTVLQGKEPSPGAHDGFSRVAREGLADEISALLTLDEMLVMVNTGSPAAQSAGGALLGRSPGAVQALGIAKITAMGTHAIASVRGAAHSLLLAALDQIQNEPSILFTLCECEWQDSREFAFGLLRDKVDLLALGVDGLVGLCDSNRVDVQNLGRELVLKHFDRLDAHELIGRLSQHPHPNMRRFALDLAVGHLKEGFVALAKLEGFFRTALFDLWPSRNEKRTVLEFLTQRGLRDAAQAEVASRLLAEMARTKARADAELAMESLVRIKLAFPEIESAMRVKGAVA